MRRQNHSCDQCRKSKRACDASLFASLDVPANAPGGLFRLPPCQQQSANEAIHPLLAPGSLYSPCSYCLKTYKTCTLDWARSQFRANRKAAVSTHDSGLAQENRRPGPPHHARELQDVGVKGDLEIFGMEPLYTPQEPLQTSSFLNISPETPSVFPDTSIDNGQLISSPFVGQLIPYDNFSIPGNSLALRFDSAGASGSSCYSPKASSGITENGSDAGPESFLEPFQAGYHVGDLTSMSGISETHNHEYTHPSLAQSEDPDLCFPSSFVTGSYEVRTSQDVCKKRHQKRIRRQKWPLPDLTSEDFLNWRSDQCFISNNLLRIYHDVLEHNMSCWVSEETCPYKMDFRQRSHMRGIAPSDSGTVSAVRSEPAQQEWGPTWSNRVYHRVVQLDRSAKLAGVVQLTAAEDQACLRALHAAMMAFASQWAQGSRRETEVYSMAHSTPSDADNPNRTGDEFDRNLQWSLWKSARTELQRCADLESFKLVCAELILGLTQRPLEDSGYEYFAPRPCSQAGDNRSHASIRQMLEELLYKEGPPLFMERATRKIHALKYRFDAYEKNLSKRDTNENAARFFGPDDRGTVGLLYWLAVMFDTVSSSMYQRPVVVADEHCQPDTVHEEPRELLSQATEKHFSVRQRWQIELFIQDNPKGPMQTLRWPCPYDAAARAVTRSAPVKILLFRHILYLQNLLRAPNDEGAVEEVIEGALLVYQYWNSTYGAFFRDLVQHYDSVPNRIQSWFVCISAHWHLGALILAELIESVDAHGQGLKEATQARLASDLAAKIKRASATELSDLARVSAPPEPATQALQYASKMADFHFAVSQGSLLTEPWTMLVIRAYVKACLYYLDVASHNEIDGNNNSRQYDQCIRALWYLGRKSDMARNAADILSSC
ncbi:Regulatory protein alcR [Tolypocladium ophioglossoides CBS 100239]|uniref:Regulatory protein alcR n=1 Tax=Tolypocladium ophioglossoides (strain CBS 100239) TaxID=1163406 RepID=A0A0L0N8N2_TOLOC|nr:Regulatory protein alcR [Tolypocladium ophioglossoides CBS 100239]